MSLALYDTGQLRFWTEHEIATREWLVKNNLLVLRNTLTDLNKAWNFWQMEGPLLTPSEHISPNYTQDDVWICGATASARGAVLRPETTASSYVYAKNLMTRGIKAPLCVWQAGKSFRRESNDGASASKLRFFEFYQQEFQCIYADTTKADYRSPVEAAIFRAIMDATNRFGDEARMVPSFRLPSYSEQTNDVEVMYLGRWTEMASISTRVDFATGFKVLEVAIGLDRLVSVAFTH